MRILHILRSRIRSLIRRDAVDAELERELRFHMECEAQDQLDDGLDPEEARLTSLRRFGNVMRVREACRDARGIALIGDLRHDVRYASRTLLRSSGFAVAVISLGLAIGSSVAVYSTADWLLNRSPEGVMHPDRLFTLEVFDRAQPQLRSGFGISIPMYEALHDVQDAFLDIAAFGKLPGVFSNDLQSEQAVVEFATGNYFDVLGVRPLLGRTFASEDDVRGVQPVAVLSYEFWRSRLGGRADVLEQPIRLNGVLSRVAGVLPPAFTGYLLDWNGPTEVWVPMQSAHVLGSGPMIERVDLSFFRVIGRLRDDVSLTAVRERAQSWLALLPPLRTPSWEATGIVITPTSEQRIGRREEARRFLGVLLVVSALILLAACASLANFLLGRAMLRRRELALRAALGASPQRLVRQLLTETLLVGACAGFFGVAAGAMILWLLAPLPRIYLGVPTTSPLTTAAALDGQMLILALACGIAAALLFGLLPALLQPWLRPFTTLKGVTPHWSWGRARLTSRQVVLVCQVALVVALAVMAGLYLRSFGSALSVTAPYSEPESVLVARVWLAGLGPDGNPAFYRNLLQRLNDMPGIMSASIGWNPPLFIGSTTVYPAGDESRRIRAGSTAAAPRFFETEGVPIVAGRDFTGEPGEQTSALIINEVLARQLWPGQDPIGQPVLSGNVPRLISGVVPVDRCWDLLDEPHPCVWQPFPLTSGSGYLRIRTVDDPLLFVPRLRALVRELHPDAAIAEAQPLNVLLGDMIANHRAAAMASSGLALLGIALLVLGTASLFLSMVRDSVRELAIRIALGAGTRLIARRILTHGAALISCGVTLGLAAAYVLSGRVADQLYKIETTDRVAFAVVPLVVAATGLVAVAYAALVAIRTDPTAHLRVE